MTPDDRDQNAQFRVLVEGVRDYAIFLLDTNGRVRTWNAGAERIKGYTADEIIGKHFAIFYPRAEARRGKPEYELRIATDEGKYEEEGWRVRKDGTTFWASVVITALRDSDGRLVGFGKVTRDLSERKRADEQRETVLDRERRARVEMEATLQHMRAIQSVTDAALSHLEIDTVLPALLDKIASILNVDTAVVLLLDADGDTLVARAARGLEEEVEKSVRIPVGHGFAGRVAQERRPIIVEDVQRSMVLNPILLEKGVRSLMGVPLLAGTRLLGVMHVGTLTPSRFTPGDQQFLQIAADRVALAVEHARLYEEAMNARHDADAATEALRVRDLFLSIAAHELKTPMTSAKMGADVLARTLANADLTPTQRQALAMVDRQTMRLSRLVTQLLDVARLQTGRLELQRTDTDLADMARATLAQFEQLSRAHRFTYVGPTAMPVTADPMRIEQVLTNLLDNAVKFSPDGGEIEISIATVGTNAVIAVRDHGIGVPPEHRPRLFERFYQAHNNRSGMGLGLNLAREIIEMHGGTMYAEFPSDGGTRFVMSLPRRAVAELAPPSEVRTP